MSTVFLTITLLLWFLPSFAQSDYNSKELQRRIELNTNYLDSASSPLHPDSLRSFIGLSYYDIDESYRLAVKVKKKLGASFTMATSSGKLKEFRQYAVLKFALNGSKFKLPIYQNIKLMRNPLYRDYLFIPFTDLTNGSSTYGGGRYIEARIPKKGELLELDFNKSFNPYCHYSTGYNCPIPPKENYLNTKIEAGEKLLYKSIH
ncbi:MAG: DUF1684 domain-containing protein [Crocinitomicaceae bacterium]|jgi:uncharacterized protein|nr:DUF1684 domain-containing protein [Crocinitomicaceae bacterium]MBT6514564.1 DUF1684 domain-containing protein [Crocinitomicaceae bacterium]MDG2331035.1 DUF1684 domain-containing protein [Flavobacteriales bacterium]